MFRPRAATFTKFLKTRTLADFPLPASGKVEFISSTATLAQAVRTLRLINALAAPVKAEDGSCVGVLDCVAIVFHVLNELETRDTNSETFEQWLTSSEKFANATVKDVIASPHFLSFQALQSSAKLADVMQLLGPGKAHRVLVQEGSDIKNIITQSAVVEYLAQNIDEFGSVGKHTMAEVGLAEPKEVISVTVDDPVFKAFGLIRDKNVSGVAVVDEDGAVCANISNRHIRAIVTPRKEVEGGLQRLLSIPVSRFLAFAPIGDVGELKGHEKHPAISCRASSTVEQVVRKLAASKIHRIFVVDDEHKPLRVVSLCDVISLFISAEDHIEGRDGEHKQPFA